MKKSIPIACTLPSEDMGERLQAWMDVLGQVAQREETRNGMRLSFPADPQLVASVAELATKEAECCAFFTFTLTIDADGAELDVAAPPEGREVLLGLFSS